MGRGGERTATVLCIVVTEVVLGGCGARTGLDEDAATFVSSSHDAAPGGPRADAGFPDAVPADAVPADASAPLVGQVRARFPWNGYATGSVWGDHGADDHHGGRRPTFQWEPVSDADYYELRVDDSCRSNESCRFPSPETFVFESTRVSLDRDLDVDFVPPVGRRYYWAVRACRTLLGETSCSEWTATRYLDVGRQRADYDGDGWADLVVGATGYESAGREQHAHFVFRGSADGLSPTPTAEILPGERSRAPANVGDLNADGYADFAIMVEVGAEPPPAFGYLAFIYYGSPLGLSETPSFFLRAEAPECAFFASLVGPGDLDGDGFADLAIGTLQPHSCSGDSSRGPAVQLFRGREDGVTEDAPLWFDGPFSSFGRLFVATLGGVGDVNGDGFPDLLVGIVDFLDHRPAVLFRGGKDGLGAGTPIRPATESPLRYYFPSRIPSVGDVDGDGYADIVAVRRPAYDADPAGELYVYYGSATGPPEHPSATLPNETGALVFGSSISGGDVNGDGLGDIAFNVGDHDEQHMRVHHGTVDGLSPTATRLSRTAPDPSPLLVVSPGDFDGDGAMDVVEAAPYGDGPGEVSIWSGAPDTLFAEPVPLPSPTLRPRTGFGALLPDSTY
jgi:hypothetical protein